MRCNFFVFFISVISAFGGFLFGFDSGAIPGALIFIKRDFALDVLSQEIFVGAVIFGAFFGAMIGGKLSDRFGRRKMLLVIPVIFIFGAFVTVFSRNFYSLILGRLMTGLAIGGSTFIVPLFISEVAPKNYRGALVLISVATITGGQALGFLSGYFFSFDESWRGMFLISIIPAFLLFVGMLFTPESPRWFVLKGRIEEARKVLFKIRPCREV